MLMEKWYCLQNSKKNLFSPANLSIPRYRVKLIKMKEKFTRIFKVLLSGFVAGLIFWGLTEGDWRWGVSASVVGLLAGGLMYLGNE